MHQPCLLPPRTRRSISRRWPFGPVGLCRDPTALMSSRPVDHGDALPPTRCSALPHQYHRFRHKGNPEFLCVFPARAPPSPLPAEYSVKASRQRRLGWRSSPFPCSLPHLPARTCCPLRMLWNTHGHWAAGRYRAVSHMERNQTSTGSGKLALTVTAGTRDKERLSPGKPGLKGSPDDPETQRSGDRPARLQTFGSLAQRVSDMCLVRKGARGGEVELIRSDRSVLRYSAARGATIDGKGGTVRLRGFLLRVEPSVTHCTVCVQPATPYCYTVIHRGPPHSRCRTAGRQGLFSRTYRTCRRRHPGKAQEPLGLSCPADHRERRPGEPGLPPGRSHVNPSDPRPMRPIGAWRVGRGSAPGQQTLSKQQTGTNSCH